MSFLDSIRSILNPNDFKGLPNQYNPNAGAFKNIAGMMNSFLSAQPQIQQNNLTKEQLLALQLQNQNTPIANALKNLMTQGQIEGQEIKNQWLPKTLESSVNFKNADAAYKQGRLQYLPQDMQVKLMNANSRARQTSPEQLQALLDWRRAATTTAPVRALTSTGKTIIEQNNVDQGLNPTGTGALPRADQGKGKELSNQYDLLRQKQSTDTQARNRNLFASNIEKTIGFIKPEVLAGYSGIAGRAKLAADAASAATGNTSPEYAEYSKIANVYAPMLATQIRQFYGDSVQPEVQQKLQLLTRPDTWKNNPEVALQNFEALRNTLAAEIQTYRDSLKGTAVYRGTQDTNNSNIPSASITKEQALAELKRRGKLK